MRNRHNIFKSCSIFIKFQERGAQLAVRGPIYHRRSL